VPARRSADTTGCSTDRVEGLLLAQALLPLQERLGGTAASVAWRFPDAHTLVLQLIGDDRSLWIDLRPPQPQAVFGHRPSEPPTRAPTGFQGLLASRAQGVLEAAEQPALDRRFALRFASGGGFVPSPAVVLEVELTGRNANAILTDTAGVILGAWREIGREVNRYREVRAGLPYRPPPPYAKPDPRQLSAEGLAAMLVGVPLGDAPRLFDGIGPRLAAVWAKRAGVEGKTPIGAAQLPQVQGALAELLADPAAALGAHHDLDSERALRSRGALLSRLRGLVDARVLRGQRQLEDADAAVARAAAAGALRGEADLLMAYAHRVPRGATQVTLPDFDGIPRTIELDPQWSAVANAERRYTSARRQEVRAERARERYPSLRAELEAAELQRQRLETLDVAALAALLAELDPPAPKAPERRLGVWLQGPHGFEVVVGRNARENEAVTFRIGRSLDVWLHAQGVTGSHVIIRSGGREVPAETLRFAAELAAGQAQVGGEGTALVDYTQRKHVWKVKGMPAGAVHYAHQRTLAVSPRRISEAGRDEGAGISGSASQEPQGTRPRR
jgi:predicted ribosome quality control (RQC) complex YloA/Tae2 family protein